MSEPVKPAPSRLLLVDDEPNNLDMLSRRLIRRGYAVDVATDGQSAIEKICRAQYDLVLLDQMMPGMSGVDLLRLLRATYSPAELPVIMVTAVDQSHTIVEALDQGANDYVVKPVDLPVITARIEAQLGRARDHHRLKMFDPLTGLSNRQLLMDRMTSALAKQESGHDGTLAVMLLDLDGFKVVNDSFGHATGDELLIETAKRISAIVSDHGLDSPATIARVGGDEFVILLDRGKPEGQLEALAEAVVAGIGRPVMIHGLSISVSASVGVALCGDRGSAGGMLRDADLAMYRAKELGKNRWHMFDPGLRERAQVRMSMAIDLRRAAEAGEMVAFYQPKFDLATRTIIGFEALLRWRHPQRGLLHPGDFIPVAEETGLIVPVGEWILNAACAQLREWQFKFPGPPTLSMNVNLSVKQLHDPDLVPCVRRALEHTGVLPGTLKLELTESCLIKEVDSTEKILGELKALDVGLKLDDFGTGYSSLSYLRDIQFDSLKIDQSFVKQLASDPESAAIVETIVRLANALHMTVVAEGIEDERQLNRLIGLGCQTGQGFYFAAPMEAGAAEALLRAQYERS